MPEPLLTIEAYQLLPADDGYRDELVRGRLVREPRPGHEHGRVQSNVVAALHAYVREHELGYVIVESGFVLTETPPTVRGPDVAFVSREMYGDARPDGFAEFSPDLAVEVVSPSNSAEDIMEKVVDYFDAGSREVWVLYPSRRQVVQYTSRSEARILSEGEDLASTSLPGFRISLSEFFS